MPNKTNEEEGTEVCYRGGWRMQTSVERVVGGRDYSLNYSTNMRLLYADFAVFS